MIFFLLAVQLISLAQAGKDNIKPVTGSMNLLTGARWVPEEKALYFVDTLEYKVHRYQPDTKKLTSVKLKNNVSMIIPVQGKSHEFIIGYGRKISQLSWDGISDKYSIHNKFEVDKDKPDNRLNDGIADPRGRLWIGSVGKELPGHKVEKDKGSLFRVSETCSLEKVLSPVSISNGIALSKKKEFMYYIDTPRRKIDIFKFNDHDGKISERKTFFDFKKNNIEGFPDGMTIDSDGNLWVAVWGHGRIIHVSSKGKLLRSLWLPTEVPTSVAWGGKDFDTLFITTSKYGLNSKEVKEQPAAGALFEVKGLTTRGLPANSVSSCYLSLPDIDD